MSDEKKKKLNSNEWQDMRLLYEHSANEIQFLKGQQWTITNYVVAVYVGVVAVSQILKNGSREGALPGEVCALLTVTATALIAGLWIVQKIDKDLLKYRNRIDESRKRLSKEFRKAQDPEKLSVREGTSRAISRILQAVIFIGGVAAGYLVIGRQLVESFVSP